jgi:ketosteroid isomerase-like protein
MTPQALQDQWEIRQLVERYCYSTDRADGDAVAQLFAEDGEFVMWLDPNLTDPTSHRRGRAEIAGAINRIRDYSHTHHSIANTVADVDGDRASGETRCDAHHLIGAPPNVRDYTLYIRYVDELARVDGSWLFSRRELHVSWVSILPVENA